MELHDAVRRRRMTRRFTGRPVDDAVMADVLAAARRAPTAGNTEGWALVVLQGPEQTARFWEATTTADWRRRSRRWPGLAPAPVVLTVFTSPARYRARYAEPDKRSSGLAEGPWPVPFWFFDAGQVVLSLLLAATDAGVGSCFIGNFRGEEALRAALGVPGDWRYVGAVLLGEPAPGDTPSASLGRPWRTSATPVHFGTWGQPDRGPAGRRDLPVVT
jgi:nitroreductase